MRSKELDIIKGIACIIMIIAHIKLANLSPITAFATTAPVVFMAASGVSGIYQLQKKQLASIFLFYSAFFFINITFINFNPVLIEIIALGTFLSILIYKYFGEITGWFFPLPYLFYKVIYHFDLIPILFPKGGDIAEFLFPLTSKQFTFIPWFSFFLFGIFFYNKSSKIQYLTLFSLLSATVAVILLKPFNISGMAYDYKFNMTLNFYLISLSIIASVFVISRYLANYNFKSNTILLFFGQQSFLFFFVHLKLVKGLETPASPLILWPLFTLLTYVVMKALIDVNLLLASQLAKEKWFWIVLILAITVGYSFLMEPQLRNFSLITSIVFALNYKYFYKLIENGGNKTST